MFQKFTERFRFHLFEGRLKKYEDKLNPTRSGLGETKVSVSILVS